MQIVFRPFRVVQSPRARSGFTLIELIVALSVIGVATTIFMKMYMTSMDFGKLSRDRQVALSIAEEQLSLLALDPSAYVWDLKNPNTEGIFRVRKEADEPRAGVIAVPPKALPPDLKAHELQANAYERFRWKLFGKLGEGGLIYEVFADVQWDRPGRGRAEHITLTGAVSRSKVEPGWTEGK